MKKISLRRNIFILVFLILLIPLVKSVIYTGLNYVLDRDEYIHSHIIYLTHEGYQPYISFFNNHAVVFHWIFSPFFNFLGYSFQTIKDMRLVMVFFFFIRILLTALLFSRLFNPFIAFLFILLYLNDPFTVFNGMQFRPDGFAILLFVIGLIFLSLKKEPVVKYLFGAGFFLGLSFITQIKILPTLILLFLFITVSYLRRKISLNNILFLATGFILPVIIIFIHFFWQGSLTEMITQVFFDSVALQKSLYIPYGFFHQPNNAYVFGLMGKPLTWIYVWLLPFTASAGAYALYRNISKNLSWDMKTVIIVALIPAAFLQWFSLFFIGGAFSQYYLSFTWLFALFTAYLIFDIYIQIIRKNVFYTIGFSVFFIIIMFLLTQESIKANNARPLQFSQEPIRLEMQATWDQIPEDKSVFPSVLFRKPSYPILIHYQFDLRTYPESVRTKFPKYVDALQKNKPEFIIASDQDIQMYNANDPRFEKYLQANFKKIEETSYYKRIK